MLISFDIFIIIQYSWFLFSAHLNSICTLKILVLAPQPFYQERGTPIAVRLLLEAFSKIPQLEVHLLTYFEGEDIAVHGVHHRSWAPSFLYGVKPGISIKKLLLDLFFLFSAIKIFLKYKPNILHCLEESCFMAAILKPFHKTNYIFDMDSRVVEQAITRWKALRIFKTFLLFIEKLSIRNSLAVIGVCPSLVRYAEACGAKKTFLLTDISLLESTTGKTEIRESLGLDESKKIILYVGNLEEYQGIDLLLESAQLVISKDFNTHFVLIGGRNSHISYYRDKALSLKIGENVHFLGPRPSSSLADYFCEVDVVVSPRISGDNTPMKLYSYLDSGKPLVATKIESHTQIVTDKECYLGEPNPRDFANAIMDALNDKDRAHAAKELVAEKYSREAFFKNVERIFGEIKTSIAISSK